MLLNNNLLSQHKIFFQLKQLIQILAKPIKMSNNLPLVKLVELEWDNNPE